MKRAQSWEEIKPLVDFCKAGRLFDVQRWISDGKPVNLPLDRPKRARWRSPLQTAMVKGFHSLIQVLLEGGAQPEEPGYSALHQAVWERRLDFIELLVENGANIHAVSMETVFGHWQPEIVEFFMSRGADVETDYPLANALIWRIRPVLGFFKRYHDKFPSLQEQINIALRHHSYEGSIKWVALLLWAGADPYSRGPRAVDEEPSPDEDYNALEWAALRGHHEIFKLKKIELMLDPSRPDSPRLLAEACYSGNEEILRLLLQKGFKLSDLDDGGASAISSLVSQMSWHYDWNHRRVNADIDSSRSREKMKILHILVRHGAKWMPKEDYEIKHLRQSLLKLTPDYTVELIWILAGYKAARHDDLEQLLRNPKMRGLIAGHLPRINELLESLRKT